MKHLHVYCLKSTTLSSNPKTKESASVAITIAQNDKTRASHWGKNVRFSLGWPNG